MGVPRGACLVLGRDSFHDTSLNSTRQLLAGDWTRDIGMVGRGIAYQADFAAAKLIENHMTPEVSTERRDRLIKLLGVDPSWRMNTLSDGQRRRVQILVKLLPLWDVLLLDEVTTDLDVVARVDLLEFLRHETELRGATIVYATHIFDGLDTWPSHVAYMYGGEIKELRVFSSSPAASSDANSTSHLDQASQHAGELYRLAIGWLRSERAACAEDSMAVDTRPC